MTDKLHPPIGLSIRDFALPVPRLGSIESHSGFGFATAEGQAIHLRVQQKRAESDSTYEAEVPLSHIFEREGYRFRVSGRIDGLFRRKIPKIEEIKSSFNAQELLRKLESLGMTHPYTLQLKTYGYFYWLEHKVLPELSFHLVSTRKSETEDLSLKLDLAEYEAWLNLRLDELAVEAQQCEKRIKRRKSVAEDFPFPFEQPRSGQKELIQAIEEGMSAHYRMLVQAPTGLGKTAGVLYPTLLEAMTRGQNVIYVTPKNSQHAVAEDAVSRFQSTGSKVKSLTVTAKSKICFKSEPLCNPEYCEFSRDYYEKVHQNRLLEKLEKKKKLDSRVFRDIGEEYQVCPFELQMEMAQRADVVICDYNYVFSPRSSLERSAMQVASQVGQPNLVIDEAHNLPTRSMDSYSPFLSSIVLEKMKEEIRLLPVRFRQDALELADDCLQVLISCRPDGEIKKTKISPPIDPFLEMDSRLRVFLSRYLDSTLEIEPRDVILRLCFYWSEFTSGMEFITHSGLSAAPKRPEFFATFHPHPTGGGVKITCCDASEMLKVCYDRFDQVVGFSATLKPFAYYAQLSGLAQSKLKTAEFQSPFLKANRKLLIIPQISTKYSDREKNYSKIANAVERIAALKAGNYFVFFPSFEFLDRVFALLKAPEGFTVLRQDKEMKPSQVEAFLDYLRQGSAQGGMKTLIFAVQGGVFSEGVDYPGEMIIGAFVIGPPLPSFDLEREEMRKYYDQHYKSGFDYAYTFPAMAKTVQAAGRVIRSETDRGLIVLMDSRFIQRSYTQSMPSDWFENSASELVSQGILKEISEFWEQEI